MSCPLLRDSIDSKVSLSCVYCPLLRDSIDSKVSLSCVCYIQCLSTIEGQYFVHYIESLFIDSKVSLSCVSIDTLLRMVVNHELVMKQNSID